jgi:NADH dehydrogenase/NADH:ubiquinone oxidoreductase subunit G
MPRVSIDGREVEVVPGSNLLAAARKLGLDIPALCYHPACTPNTACMACVMKLKSPDRIVPSCATVATDGMCVESETDEVRALRRTALELLLSDHGDDSPEVEAGAALAACDCAKREVCRLRKYAVLYGADPTRFRGERRKVQPRQDHPEVEYDPRKCILCGICTQLAQQAGEPLGLAFIGRGFDLRGGCRWMTRSCRRCRRRLGGARGRARRGHWRCGRTRNAVAPESSGGLLHSSSAARHGGQARGRRYLVASSPSTEMSSSTSGQ